MGSLKTEKSLWVKYSNFTKFVTRANFRECYDKHSIINFDRIIEFWHFPRCNEDPICRNPRCFRIYIKVMTPTFRLIAQRSVVHRYILGKHNATVDHSRIQLSKIEYGSISEHTPLTLKDTYRLFNTC